jgi:hypothetical protein
MFTFNVPLHVAACLILLGTLVVLWFRLDQWELDSDSRSKVSYLEAIFRHRNHSNEALAN